MVQLLCESVARMFGQEESRNDMTSKKRRRHTPDQIIRKLAEGHKLLAANQELDAAYTRREARGAGGQSIGRPKALDQLRLRWLAGCSPLASQS